jgi:hypothetical protein
MQMAQVPQRRLIFIAHSARELRIIQPLIARGLRHILQYAQSLPNRLPPILGHLLPLGQHIIPNVTLLLRTQAIPPLGAISQFLLLRRRKIPVLVVVLENLLPVLRRQIAEFSLRLWRHIRGRRPIRIVVRIRARARHGVRPVPATALRISRAAVRMSTVLRRSCRILRRRSLMLWRPVLRFRRRMLLRRKMGSMAALRHRRGGHHCAEPHRQQTSYELESKSHQLHRLIIAVILRLVLVLIRVAVARVFRLHRLRQVRQCSEIRKHVIVFKHRQILIDLCLVRRR